MPKTTLQKNSFIFQRNVAIIGVILFFAKLLAWQLTQSDAIFSDALESIVNIIAAFLGLFSLYIAAKPNDSDHPFGHGKIEFVSSGIEGALVFFAGIIIIIESVISLINGNIPQKLDVGMVIIAITAIANYIIGYISIEKGEKLNSTVLISSGNHLQSDTFTTIGVFISLILVYYTHIYWLDALIALLFGTYIMWTAFKIMRNSLKGIMDEADPKIINEILEILNKNRKNDWVDIHHLRIQQHGSKLLIEGHITLPYYYELRKAHEKLDEIEQILQSKNRRKMEFNFHLDDCKTFSCQICSLENCAYRSQNHSHKIFWTENTITQTKKHEVSQKTF